MDLLKAPPTDRSLAGIIEGGLPHARRKAHVIIAGAGMGGLVAGYELHRAGHDVTILEAQNRVGGRIYTLRDRFAAGLAAEMGAMRVPTSHELTMAYIRRFELPTAPFRSNNDQAYTFIHGVRRRNHESVDESFDLRPDERGLGVAGLLARTLAPLRAQIEAEGPAGWAAVERAHATTSLRDFLLGSGWSDGAIDMFGILARHESLMDSAFLEFFRGSNDVSSPMVRILGGMDRLPNSFLTTLEPYIRYGVLVRAIEQGPDFVRVHCDNAAGRRSITGDYLICTLPYSILRHIEATPEFSATKQRAIRQIHYDNASKIFFQFRRRFWEHEGIGWGSTITDLPIRNVVYPEPEHAGPRGLLIASYTWAQDAQRWASLSEPEQVTQALENLTRIHPRAPEYFEAGASHVWQNDPFAGGAYTVFQPGQQLRLHEAICRPEGRVHFAGEHTSLLHRWVEGAVESGLRAALEVSLAAQRRATLGDIDAGATLLHAGVADPEGAPAEPLAVLDALLDADTEVDESRGRPLHRALCGKHPGHTAIAGHLRRRGAAVDLAFAAGLGEVELVRRWLAAPSLPDDAYSRYRPDVDRLDALDRAAVLAEALTFAAMNGQLAAAAALLDAGADPSALVPAHGVRRTALHAAAEVDDVEMVALLVSRGADPYRADAEWASSALSWAVLAGADRVVAWLRAGGFVLLDDLVYVGTVEEIEAALAGRHPDTAQVLGAPGVLLRNAAHRGRRDVCERLVALGADRTLRSPVGLTPADIAARAGHPALAAWLGG